MCLCVFVCVCVCVCVCVYACVYVQKSVFVIFLLETYLLYVYAYLFLCFEYFWQEDKVLHYILHYNRFIL